MDQTRRQDAQPMLTLSHLYRMLTNKNYPGYTCRVFPEDTLRGLTLVRFWSDFFQRVFPESMDMSVFRQVNGQNRTLSRLLNGTGSARLMEKWFHTLAEEMDKQMILSAAEAWMDLLERMHYAPDSLSAHLSSYFQQLRESSEWAEGELPHVPFFAHFSEPGSQNPAKTDESASCPALFRYAYILSFLTFFSLFSGRVHQTAFIRLQIVEDLSCQSLYRKYLQGREPAAPRVISTRECLLCAQALDQEDYFGNDQLFAAVLDAVRLRHKAAVCGMGGCGKTEFVRQLLPRLLRQEGYARIAFVQFRSSLEDSFSAAFPMLQSAPAHERLRLARRLLEDPDQGRTLLLMDNVDLWPSEDPALSGLSSYGCDILLTSRFFEPEGFSVFHFTGLSPEDGCRLFLHHCSLRGIPPESVEALGASVGFHPLALTLFARLCRTRFWSVQKLRAHLAEKGLENLSYVHAALPVRLTEVFSGLFDLSHLTPAQLSLMQLLSLLPYQYRVPEELLPYASDMYSDADQLGDDCQVLHDIGWLLVSDTGYAVHPLIAETVRSHAAQAGQFPRLWAYLQAGIDQGSPEACRALAHILPRLGQLNLAAIRCLSSLEQQLGNISWLSLPHSLYTLHEQYLRNHGAETADTVDLWIGKGFRGMVETGSRENLKDCFLHILREDPTLTHLRCRSSLYALLEYACAEPSLLEDVRRIFGLLRPEDPHSLEMAYYLNSYSMLERRGCHEPASALRCLSQAEQILSGKAMHDSLPLADLAYRRSVCLLDLGRAAEAKHALESCLRILQHLHYPDDASKTMSTRGTYAVALSFCGRNQEALGEYHRLADVYRRQNRTECAEYAMLRNNTALLMDQMGYHQDAIRIQREVLLLDDRLTLPADLVATHQRNAAMILAHLEQYEEAMPLAMASCSAREEVFGPDSPWTADSRAVLAFLLFHTGDREKAMSMISASCDVLQSAWGPEHRHILHALGLKQAIFGKTPPAGRS